MQEYSRGITPASQLEGITAGPDGKLWFAEYAANKIAQITPPLNERPWTEIGPRPFQSGGSTFSGRVLSVALDPSRHIVYVGTLGGVWHSYDWGATWAPSQDNTLPGAIGAVAVDNNGWVFAASGSVDGGELGSGVYVSQDSGKHWTRTKNLNAATGKPSLEAEAATSIVLDRSNPKGSLQQDHLFVTTTGGIYDSHDGGDTWTRQTLPDPATTAWQILQDPVNAKRWEAVVSTGVCTGEIVEEATGSPGWVTDVHLTSADPGGASRVPLRMSIAGNVSRIAVLATGCDGGPYSDANHNGPIFYHDSPDGNAITGSWDNFGAIMVRGQSDPFYTGNSASPTENGNATNSILLDPRSDHRCDFLVGGVFLFIGMMMACSVARTVLSCTGAETFLT